MILNLAFSLDSRPLIPRLKRFNRIKYKIDSGASGKTGDAGITSGAKDTVPVPYYSLFHIQHDIAESGRLMNRAAVP